MSGLQNPRHPGRADYDWREFARLVRQRCAEDGRGYRFLAEFIGVTSTDLSRAASGQMIAVHKVIAICDWMKVAVRAFYIKPTPVKSSCCSRSNVKHSPGAAPETMRRAQ